MECFRNSCEDKHLYVILPYFNFCSSHRRQSLFLNFVSQYTGTNNVRLVVIECIGKNPLPYTPGIYQHIKVTSNDVLWIKESLINIAIGYLPRCWKYVAWIDADISFISDTWARDTIRQLQTFDIVQCFRTAIHLGPNGEPIKQDKSFGYMFVSSGTPYTKNDKYGFWHPGFAWACTRHAYTTMGRLLDWAILGSADRHMAYALMGRVLDSAPGNVHTNYKVLLSIFQQKVKHLKFGWVDGTIVHHWHGSLKDRKYRERWDILVQGEFDPLNDVGLNKHNLVQFTILGKRLHKDIQRYFHERNEDGNAL